MCDEQETHCSRETATTSCSLHCQRCLARPLPLRVNLESACAHRPQPRSTTDPSPLPMDPKPPSIPPARTGFEASSQSFPPSLSSPSTPSPTHARATPQDTAPTRAKQSSSATSAASGKLDARQAQEMDKPDTPPLLLRTPRNSSTAATSSSGPDSPCMSMETSILSGADSEVQNGFIVNYNVTEVPENLLYHVFKGKDRLKMLSCPADFAGSLKPSLYEGSRCYELVSVKLQEDDNGGAFWQKQKAPLHAFYLQVARPGMAQQELERLGNFAELSPPKSMSRLELLQTPPVKFEGGKTCKTGVHTKNEKTRLAIFDLEPSHFELRKTEGNDGCATICEKFLCDLFGGNTAAKRMIAIQVRVVVPGLGIFKGMLMRRQQGAGGPAVQLTPSMRKVGPAVCREMSLRSSTGEQARMLVCGKFPSLNAQMVGRNINPKHPLQVQGRPPASATPQPLVKRGKSEMIPRLWNSLGVTPQVILKYKKQCTSWEHNKHCYVVGCTDPTHAIPSTHVFVTGCHAGGEFVTEQFFVTRSPCIDPKDGRVLEQLTCRPAGMSQEDWDWLLSMPFGAILYPDAPPGKKPMPSLIANGDLDGDLYFVCWDPEVLASLKHAVVVEAVRYEQDTSTEPDEGGKAAVTPPEDKQWLEKTQELMMDCATASEIRSLYSKLYNLSCKTADKHEHGQFMHHPDARAFAAAYAAALDYQKHCKPIPLPEHLVREHLPLSQHKYFEC